MKFKINFTEELQKKLQQFQNEQGQLNTGFTTFDLSLTIGDNGIIGKDKRDQGKNHVGVKFIPLSEISSIEIIN